MKYLYLVLITVFLSSCGGGTSNTSTTIPNFNISGTVPGTIIEAYGDNGSYYKTTSNHNNSGMHPFILSLKAGVNYSLFMTVNEDTAEAITTPIYI
jgi:hypothetical protein